MNINRPDLLEIDRRQEARRKRREESEVSMTALVIVVILLIVSCAVACKVIDLRCSPKIADLSAVSESQEQTPIAAVDRGDVVSREPPDMQSLTTEERTLVEQIVAAEARGESQEGKEAVAQVILDRAVTWGQTITQVCTAPKQFAAPYRGEIGPEVKEAVSAVFDQDVRVFEEPTTHFCSGPTVYWESGDVDRGQIGRNRFYN